MSPLDSALVRFFMPNAETPYDVVTLRQTLPCGTRVVEVSRLSGPAHDTLDIDREITTVGYVKQVTVSVGWAK